MSLSEIFKELDDRALVVSSYGAEKALNAIVNSFRDLDKMQINRDVKTAGFYLIDGKITMATNAVNSIKHPMPSKEQIIECVEFIDLLYREYCCKCNKDNWRKDLSVNLWLLRNE
jgi:hypothetical protein